MKSTERIKDLRLTKAGEIKLSIFSKEARDTALNTLRAHKGIIKDVFKFYYLLCMAYCKDKGIIPDYHRAFSMLRAEGLSKDSPGIHKGNPYTMETVVCLKASQPYVAPLAIRSDNKPSTPQRSLSASLVDRPRETRAQFNANMAKMKDLQNSDDPFIRSIMGDVMTLCGKGESRLID